MLASPADTLHSLFLPQHTIVDPTSIPSLDSQPANRYSISLVITQHPIQETKIPSLPQHAYTPKNHPLPNLLPLPPPSPLFNNLPTYNHTPDHVPAPTANYHNRNYPSALQLRCLPARVHLHLLLVPLLWRAAHSRSRISSACVRAVLRRVDRSRDMLGVQRGCRAR
jgi:hypothetical protein